MKPFLEKSKPIIDLFKDSLVDWFQSDSATYAAALAYYTIFSLAPLLIISVVIATQLFSQAAVEGRIVTAAENLIGTQTALFIEDIIKNSQGFLSSSVATGVSLMFVIFGASSVFRQLRYSINAMWGIVMKSDDLRQSLFSMLKNYLLSALAVLTVGLFLLGALILSALWAALPEYYYQTLLNAVSNFIPLFRYLSSPTIFFVVFIIIFKTMPKATIRWRDVWPGAGLTAFLFWVGSYFVGIYLGNSSWTSLYGAAGSVIAFLLWVYYSTWIFLFGAKFTQLFADRFGVPIEPDRDAMFLMRSDIIEG
ncbi:MAG: YihY/virulence factor BrkB family protein [Anaerolineae bacterium]|nr:YihY/virulence factor BrkB family protein [Anaerolineae bacterium]